MMQWLYFIKNAEQRHNVIKSNSANHPSRNKRPLFKYEQLEVAKIQRQHESICKNR